MVSGALTSHISDRNSPPCLCLRPCRKVTETLFKELGHCERPILNRVHGRLALYCCLREDGKFLSQADEKFDGELRGRSPDFGIRNLQDIVGLAEEEGLQLLSKEFLAGGTNQFLQFGFKQ